MVKIYCYSKSKFSINSWKVGKIKPVQIIKVKKHLLYSTVLELAKEFKVVY